MHALSFRLLTAWWILLGTATFATGVSDTIYINRGVFTTVNGTTFPFLAFNTTAVFSAQTPVFELHTNDTLLLTVVNNDTALHGFRIDALNEALILGPNENATLTLNFLAQGVFVYRDHLDNPMNRYMGLCGIIAVDNSNAKKYYWLLREHQQEFNAAIAAGQAVNWSQYNPNYFTVNGWSFPDLQTDSTARVEANVGDTVHIYVVNAGQSAHSIHFHGFHCTVLQSATGVQNGRSKDTLPFRPMEAMTLEMVPDKEGEYSVHDHNLVAVSGGGTHPNGMFLIMKILP